MSTTDRTFTTRYKVLKGQVINKFHLQNPTKQLEGQTTPASIITIMNNSRATPSCCTEAPVTTPTILLYNTDQGSSFDWGGNTFTRTTNFSYTATITSIPASRVPYHTNLIGVTIGNTVISIGSNAFSGCEILTSLIFAPTSSLVSIGPSAFFVCRLLSSIIIPNSVTSIGTGAFQSCFGFTSVTISNLVTSISSYAFQACLSLTSVTIPNLVTSIDERAFDNCPSLTSVIFVPSSTLRSIDRRAFSDCGLLTSIIIPNSVTSIGDLAFRFSNSLTSIIIPNSVTSIGVGAFLSSGLTTVTIANGQLGIASPTGNPPGVAFFGTTVTTILP